MPSPTSLSDIRAEALARRERGDLHSARTLLEQSLEAATMAAGEDHPEVLTTGHLLATLHRQAGDFSQARRVLENALYAGGHRFGDDDPLMLSMSFDLAEIADELGNRHEARRQYAKVAKHGPQVPGFDPQQIAAARAWLGPDAPPLPQATPVAPVEPPTQVMHPQPVAQPEPPTQVLHPQQPPAPRPADPEPPTQPIQRQTPPPQQPTAAPDKSATQVLPVIRVDRPTVGVGPQTPPAPPADPAPAPQPATPHLPPQAHPAPQVAPAPQAHTAPPVSPAPHTRPAPPVPPTPHAAPPVTSVPPVSPAPYTHPAPQAHRTPQQQTGPAVIPVPAPPQTAPRHLPEQQPTSLPAPTVFVPPAAPPPPRRGRGAVVAATAAAVVAVLAAVTTLLLVILPKNEQEPPTVADPRPAGDLQITSEPNGDVTISWYDPSEGIAAQMVMGGRSGEQLTRMGSPAHGERQYTVHGLNRNWDYCFQILLIYSQVQMLESEQVCTERGTSPAPSPSVTR